MKKLLSLIGVFGITANIASLGSSTIFTKGETTILNNNKESNFSMEKGDIQVEYLLKRAIKLHNNKIEIDYNRLESLKNYEFYENLRSSGYAKYLNDMYLMGILKFDKNKNPLFLDYAELNANDNKLKPRISGWANADISKCKVWVIPKWYWFGRWELHFNNYLTNVLIDLGNDISLILNILYSFPEALPIL